MMQDIFGSVRRSLVFRPNPNGDEASGGIADKIGSCLRKSRVGLGLGLGFPPKLTSPPPPMVEPEAPPIRWRKGDFIGCGAFGHVYMGMNLDSGELLAVKQVQIGTNSASKAKAQPHIRELEEEIKLLKNLSHPNIVRYLGTSREEDTLNILLEFVPGGSISSLLGKFGAFPEAVIRTYTKQLLQGLEYLHRNKIIHRDIKGANILVDNKGCIKLADFGASKQVAQLATVTAAKSMKGTPYWMAPEVIVQSGHSFSADIWSVGCTVIEMATGKPPWSQQYQEVAALFHVGTTKSHPPIPEHLSPEAKDFLLKCLQREPNLRATASDLLQHPFVTGEHQDTHPISLSSIVKPSLSVLPTSASHKNSSLTANPEKPSRSRPMWEMSTNDDMCRFDAEDDFPVVGSSFNPVSEPLDDWPCKFDQSSEQRSTLGNWETNFAFPCEAMAEDDDEVTETKIRAFLDEKAIVLKKLQTPLYEEFYNTLNTASSPLTRNACKENYANNPNLPPKSKPSPVKASISYLDTVDYTRQQGSSNCRVSSSGVESSRVLKEVVPPRLNEIGELLQDPQQEPDFPSASFSERRRQWKEELDKELEREREMRQVGVGRTSSPKDGGLNRKRDRFRFNSPAK